MQRKTLMQMNQPKQTHQINRFQTALTTRSNRLFHRQQNSNNKVNPRERA